MRHHSSLLPVIIDGTYLSSYKALSYLKKEHKMGKENCQGLTGLTVNTPKMHTFPYSHIKISIYIYFYYYIGKKEGDHAKNSC